MKKTLLVSLIVFLFAACQKTSVSNPPATPAQTEKTVPSLTTTSGELFYTSKPEPFTFTDCTTKPLKTSCGNFRGGMVAYCGGFYGDLTMIRVESCNGLAFAKKASQVEVHQGSACGDIVGRGTITPNANWANIYFNLGYIDSVTYTSVVVLPNGRKMYANPILITQQP